jgi:hypothetical protein
MKMPNPGAMIIAVSTGVLFLLLGIMTPMSAQRDHNEQDAKQQNQKQQQQARPAKQELQQAMQANQSLQQVQPMQHGQQEGIWRRQRVQS